MLFSIFDTTLMANRKSIRENAMQWIWLEEKFWNKGICKEAMEKVVNFAFYGVKTKCILANCRNKNVMARRALESGGFFKYNIYPKSKPNDENSLAQYRMLREDYKISEVDSEKYNYEIAEKSVYSFENPIRKIDSIKYIEQPTGYLCGQAVIAMLAEVPVVEVIMVMQNDMGTGVTMMQDALDYYGFKTSTKSRRKYVDGAVLPKCCVLSIKMPDYGHWSLYYDGNFYDPEFGVSTELPPQAKLRSYWEVLV